MLRCRIPTLTSDLIQRLLVADVAAILMLVAVSFWRGWLGASYDRKIWSFAWTRTLRWLTDKAGVDAAVLLGTFLIAFASASGGAIERFLTGIVQTIGAAAIGFVFTLIWFSAQAPMALLEAAKEAPYDADVAFDSWVEHATLFLRVRSHLSSGFFSAQIWLIDGIVETYRDAITAAWKNTTDDKKEIRQGEEQYIQLLTVHPEIRQEGGLRYVGKIVLFEAGGQQREIHPRSFMMRGDDIYTYQPMKFHLKVTDPTSVSRRVVVWLHIFVIGQELQISTCLVRPY
jgi:hypothetical protein